MILLLGAEGQVGRELRPLLEAAGELLALARADADLTDVTALRAVMRRHRPAIIVNAAAYTAVDRAEQEAEVARAINATAPGVLAEEAAALGATLVHYSTDYVFDGRKDTPYAETDATGPLSVYGRTKLDGERAIEAAGARHLIFRTSWVFGRHRSNFLRTMLRLAGERDELRVVADQVGAPTSAALIARVTVTALEALRGVVQGDARWGLHHLAAGGETSWHGFARRIVEQARARGVELRTRPDAVVPITTGEYPAAAARPANSRLDTSRLRAAFALDLPHWTADVDDMIAQLTRQPQGTTTP